MSRKTIVFDFDGVIHKGYKGYKDGSIYGTIDFELLEFMKELMRKYYVVISSNRDAEQIVEYMSNIDTELEFEVFKKDKYNLYWENENVIGVTNEKAIGILYVDDRGFRYDKEQTTGENIEAIRKILTEED